jgi:hypothetical protein
VFLRPGDRTAYQPGDHGAFQPDDQTGYQPEDRTGYQPGVGGPASPYLGQPSGVPVSGHPDEVRAEAIRRDPFSAEWLEDSELASRRDTEHGWRDNPDNRPSPGAADSWFARPEASTPTAEDAVTESWFAPRELAESELAPYAAPGERGDTGTAAPFTQDERVDAGFRPPGDQPGAPPASWPEEASIAAGGNAAPGAPAAALTQPASRPDVSLTPPGAARDSGEPATPGRERRSDRFSPVRLLVVIVLAAAVGSVLVLLLH